MPETMPRTHLADEIEERQVGPCRLLTLRTPVRDVVSWHGSFLTDPDFAVGEELVQVITAGLLDKGTLRRDRFALADLLENRGAELDFVSDSRRVDIVGQALRADVPAVLGVLGETLREPLFDAEEFEKARAQYRSSLHRALENTSLQATSALSRQFYTPAHPNYTFATAHALEQLEALTLEQVRAYHTQHFGSDGLVLIFVGDVDTEAVVAALEEALGDWPPHAAPSAFMAEAASQPPGRIEVPIPDRRNLDVRLGHALRLRRHDPDFVPLFVANYILGGNFSARLMMEVRNRQGLTYGIRSSIEGLHTEHEGHWQVSVTLSQENLERGIEATRDVVQQFVDEGVTEDELREKQTTIAGAYKVGLATTGGLAATLHLHATRGLDVGYVDRFTEEVAAVTRTAANEAVARHFDPEALHLVLAGLLPEAE